MTKKELEAANLTLLTALNEAVNLLDTDNATVAEKVDELREIIKVHKKSSRFIYKQIQSDTIAGLRFPAELRKMWSGGEVQDWLTEQSKNVKK